MTLYYRFMIYGVILLFLAGTAPVALSAQKNFKIYKNYAAFQNKQNATPNSLIRPKTIRPGTNWKQNGRQNKAQKALKSGRIVSLSVIRKRVQQSFPGKIIDVRLEEPMSNNRPYIYRVKLLRKDGKLLNLKINAANARIVSVKGNK